METEAEYHSGKPTEKRAGIGHVPVPDNGVGGPHNRRTIDWRGGRIIDRRKQ